MALDTESRTIVDYDSDGYDYRNFWHGRDYERWAEARILRRLISRLQQPRWFADFGGGFGRNADLYLSEVEHALLIDYSVTNLSRAAELHPEAVAAGHLHLIRADLAALPLRDRALQAGMVIRVLHHFESIDSILSEMARTLARQFLIDVPIKHHLLGRIRATVKRQRDEIKNWEPRLTGSTQFPFHTYHLDAVRHRLDEDGWSATLAASGNNLRRWDQLLPAPVVTALRPAVYGVEAVAQPLGRGWWGPSQFLVARRRRLMPSDLAAPDLRLQPPIRELARRLQCPACRGELSWTQAEASCAACGVSYSRDPAGYWDFTRRERSPRA